MPSSSINSFSGGLNTDIEPIHIPEGDYTYALNAKLDGEKGVKSLISNERGNEVAGAIPDGWIVCGHCYMRDGDIALFLSKPHDDPKQQDSQIGIFNVNGTYTTKVHFNKLKFSPERPIDCIFRLRRGCERTIYWTEKGEDAQPPRYFIFENEYTFKFANGRWNVKAFLLQKSYQRPPSFKTLQVREGGKLKPGSYFVSVQYIDANDNKTEWIATSKKLNVYHSSTYDYFPNINGSIDLNHSPFDFGQTDKCIEVELGDIDYSYPKYRLAFICYNSGYGNLTGIWSTDDIPTLNNRFLYNGGNAPISIPVEDFSRTNVIYTKAKSIEQIDNRLVLGNVEELNINWCRLQYYASKISADCVVQEYNLSNATDPFNPKNPSVDDGCTGYLPEEVYSFGIVYVFEGGIKSPVYHIPGKSPNVGSDKIYNWSSGTYGMDNSNSVDGKFYVAKPGFNYWGKDCEGNDLEGKPVRHHRFPSRRSIDKPFYRLLRGGNIYKYALRVYVEGTVPPVGSNNSTDNVTLMITYKQGGIVQKLYVPIDINANAKPDGDWNFSTSEYGIYLADNSTFTDIAVFYVIGSGDYQQAEGSFNVGRTTDINVKDEGKDFQWLKNLKVGFYTQSKSESAGGKTMKGYALGIKFSNISRPSLDDTNGYKCIGYYIVRNERTDLEKTIVDSVAVTPGYRIGGFAGVGAQISPIGRTAYTGDGDNGGLDFNHENRFKRQMRDTQGGFSAAIQPSANIYNLVSPRYLFEGKKLGGYDYLYLAWFYRSFFEKYGFMVYNDVMDGSTFDEKTHRKAGSDDGGDKPDGWSWGCLGRDTEVFIERASSNVYCGKENIHKVLYLDALDSVEVKERGWELFNLSSNNRAIALLTNDQRNFFEETGANRGNYGNTDGNQKITPAYGVLKKTSRSPYTTFDVMPYFSETTQMIDFVNIPDEQGNVKPESVSIYGGDSYVFFMRYVSIFFISNLTPSRVVSDKGIWKQVAGAFLVVGGLAATVFTAGLAAAAGVAAIGAGAMLLSSGIKQHKAMTTLGEKYSQGVFKLAIDRIFFKFVARNYGCDGIIPMKGWRNGDKGKTAGGGGGDAYNKYVQPGNTPARLGAHGPSDDIMMWGYDCVSDLAFECDENYSLRHGFNNSGLDPFLPSYTEDGFPCNQELSWWGTCISKGSNTGASKRLDGLGDRHSAPCLFYWDASELRTARNRLETYVQGQVLKRDQGRSGGWAFKGVPYGTFYGYNPDYKAKCRLKPMFCIPRDYSCTSGCQNKYPNRIVWSKQSFQESRADNYTQLLPNDYTDIPGVSGDISKVIRFNNKLYTFTTEALWEHPETRQERMNDGVVTYIGTGEFLSVPPRRLLDSVNGIGGGCLHSNSVIKTPYGLAFVSYSDKKVYLFDGQLKVISDIGMSMWFKDNLTIDCDEIYFRLNERRFRFRDNTFLPIGSGFVLGYDNYSNRLLVTKRDIYGYGDEAGGFVVSSNGNDKYIFRNYQGLIDGMVSAGWEYLGIDGIKMQFRKFQEKMVTQEVTTTKFIKVPEEYEEEKDVYKDASIFTFKYQTYDPQETGDLDIFFKISSPAGIMRNYIGYGSGYKGVVLPTDNKYYCYAGDWQGGDAEGAEMIGVNVAEIRNKFAAAPYIDMEAWGYWFRNPTRSDKAYIAIQTYEGGTLRVRTSPKNYVFVDDGRKLGEVNYPADGIQVTKQFISKGGVVSGENKLEAFNTTLIGKFRYYLKTGKFVDISNPTRGEVVIGDDGGGQNKVKVNKTRMVDKEVQEKTEKQVKKLVPVFTSITAEPFNPTTTNNSWTISYSFNNNRWISYHSYIPSVYMFDSDNMYSFIAGDKNIYKHNSKLFYNYYFGKSSPHIIEFVCKASDLRVGIFESIQFNTDAIVQGFDSRYITFNKAVIYNGRQCSGMLELKPRENTDVNWMEEVTGDNGFGVCSIDKRERNWHMNDFYDIRRLYNSPIWNEDIRARQNDYFTDKVLNVNSLAEDMDWRNIERFRDRYIVVRLIFDNRNDTKLLTRFFSANIIRT